MGMLAWSPEKIQYFERYEELLNDDKWENLVEMFIKESCHINSLTNNPLLIKILSIGISILKTIFCSDSQFFKENCPTCSVSFQSLWKEVPFVHKTTTTLICRISGKVMDENNPPLVLPNGNIYSENALIQQATDNNGYVICPKTTTRYLLEKCKKVYIS